MSVSNIEDRREKGPVARDKKERAAPMPLLYDDFPAGAEVARKLIKQYHPHLVNAGIIYACRNKAQKKSGVASPGYIKKLNEELQYAFQNKVDGDDPPNFLLVIALEVWNDMAPNQRTAVIDHLLTRIVGDEDEKTGDMKWGLRPPSVQEFPEVAERNGKWNKELENMADSLEGK